MVEKQNARALAQKEQLARVQASLQREQGEQPQIEEYKQIIKDMQMQNQIIQNEMIQAQQLLVSLLPLALRKDEGTFN